MSDLIDQDEMRRCLKEAHIYEENMSEDLMTSYYKAIKNSENSLRDEIVKINSDEDEIEKTLNESANELLEAINNSETIAPSNRFKISETDDEDSPSTLTKHSSLVRDKGLKNLDTNEEEEEENNNSIENEGTEKPLDVKKVPIGFNDMPQSVHKDKPPLNIICHELRFVNVQNSKKFLISSTQMRVKMLYEYHIAANKLKAHYARLSPNMASLKTPIQITEHREKYENPIITSLKGEESQTAQETYVSRSGRLTKRKVYTDNYLSDDSCGSSKKSKLESNSFSKSSSKEKPTKSTLKMLDYPENDIVPLRKENALDEFDQVKNTPKPKMFQKKSLNDEIMSRSSLFRDSVTPKKARSEMIVAAGISEAEKSKDRQDVIDKFTNSLNINTESQEDDTEKIIIDDDIEVFERKRVVPPCPGPRRGIHSKRKTATTGLAPLNITTKKTNSNNCDPRPSTSSDILLKKRVNSPKISNLEERPTSTSTPYDRSAKKVANMTPCPLCSVLFPRKEIEEHAATCGEDMFAQVASTRLSRISCEICDQVIPLTTEYEVHVKQCIAKQNGL
ncbi:uncharacterized protein LOC115891962 [Sitophilus oryzae]|uniref:Uncharacterized protein LOC115891962 n=1 Tax=Sitophilus oryzae TaxID=7048 RepID=A0A6J2YYZ3_SITOR|nr:uncharacterized protein LOC115891962 [Sitophilus oryzae]